MKTIIKDGLQRLKAKYPVVSRIRSQILSYFKKPISVRQGGHNKALICYITHPFQAQNHRHHSNQKEVIVMADVLAELDFVVDVVDYNSEFDIDYAPYNLLIGFGGAFARSFSAPNFRGKRILHMTGANPNFSNEAEARRSRSLWVRRGVLLAPRREVYWPWMFSAINADAMFILGNNWTRSTYDGLNQNTYLISVPYVAPVEHEVIRKDFSKTKQNFCWFAGGGAVHKGLDILLEAICVLDNDFHLDVCGPIGREMEFVSLYRDLLFANPKVSFHGFVDVGSQKMRDIIANNTFVILPSCSEGGASSVITCMAAGLIPVVTKESSIEIGDFGILIENSTNSSILETMLLAGTMSREELEVRSEKSAVYARLEHSYDHYAKVLRASILCVVDFLKREL
ncbi:glycosyltransferase family 4 protein [Desulfopila sp. IMCC35006]|uniref:glycosyltransferase n=1 Tax=Desulfopila sp. IMCC35006 TaxID=2569542 RepID=UPI0010AB79A4|nr:glycosyltransferase [Desulfopila sp. IMCC35006]TKB26457.1 glycosyltransferase family 4 protein [Desulfopila sp. IMCC35006]